jgi:hypothetical protein
MCMFSDPSSRPLNVTHEVLMQYVCFCKFSHNLALQTSSRVVLMEMKIHHYAVSQPRRQPFKLQTKFTESKKAIKDFLFSIFCLNEIFRHKACFMTLNFRIFKWEKRVLTWNWFNSREGQRLFSSLSQN